MGRAGTVREWAIDESHWKLECVAGKGKRGDARCLPAIRSLNYHVLPGKNLASWAFARACVTKNNMNELLRLLKGRLDLSGRGLRSCKRGRSRGAAICLDTPAPELESKGTVSDSICDVQDGFPVEASQDLLYLSAESCVVRIGLFLCTLYLCSSE